MKTTLKKYGSGLRLAALGAVLLASAGFARAQVVTNDGDLILAFRVTDGTGTGATTNFEYDLGSSANFTSTSTIAFTNLTLDLSNAYGTGYQTRTDLAWSIDGEADTGSTGNATLFTTSPGDAYTYNRESGSQQSGPASKLNVETSVLGEYTAVADNASAADVTTSGAASGDGSYTGEEVYSKPYNYFAHNIESGVTAATETADLYEMAPGSGVGTDLGTFTLTSGGTLTFTGSAVAAVPEPSTYALLVLGALVFLCTQKYVRNSGRES